MISSFEVRTYSTTTLGKAQGCQLFEPNQEPKARSDYVLAQPSTLHASRPRFALVAAGACHREWPSFYGHRFACSKNCEVESAQARVPWTETICSSPRRCRAAARLNVTITIRWSIQWPAGRLGCPR